MPQDWAARAQCRCSLRAARQRSETSMFMVSPRARDGQVFFETVMVGNLAEKSFALAAIVMATWRATAL